LAVWPRRGRGPGDLAALRGLPDPAQVDKLGPMADSWAIVADVKHDRRPRD